MTELSETPIPETPGLAWGPYTAPQDLGGPEAAPTPEAIPAIEAAPATQPLAQVAPQIPAIQAQVPQTSIVDPNAKIVETLAMIAERISAPQAPVAPAQTEATPAEIADVFMSNVQAAKEMLARAGLEPTAENYASVRTQLLIEKARWEADQKVARLESLIERQSRMMQELYSTQRLASLDLSPIPEAVREDIRPLVSDLVKRGVEPAQAIQVIQTRLGGLLAKFVPQAPANPGVARPVSTPGQIAATTLQPQSRDATGRFQSGMTPAQRIAAMEAMIYGS